MTDDMINVAESLDKIAQAIKSHDATPTPTRKQFVRQAAVQIAAAALSGTKREGIVHEMLNGLAVNSIKLAEEIWEKTQ